MKSDRPFLIHPRVRTILAAGGLWLSALAASAQSSELFRSWNQPAQPFRIIGNVHYVGASDVSSYLITTPEGHILLEGGFAETAPLIEQNVRELGFRIEDIKILLTSHAHLDHAGGLAELKRLSGATLVATAPEAEGLARGGKGDFQWGDTLPFPPVVADRIIADGETVSLGGITLTAHLTPGHTKGSTTWTMRASDRSRSYDIVFMASLTAPGYDLVANPQYPNIGADLLRSCTLLRALPCDIYLAPHGFACALKEKRALLGAEPNPFVDPAGYRSAIDQAEQQIQQQLGKSTAAPRPPEAR
ncbi:MAG TPA: subclass B3 metallo-beta-lactamase [Opitutaceae bacterium]|nr:subclass B3 metallo-beta-lactamase [Opitutaceae bacterium]